ncbi:MAG: hypothetical protein RL748_2484 [Pseudomonadota bacterium]|jgi:UPF0755 protein
MKKFLFCLILLLAAAAWAFHDWSQRAIFEQGEPIAFTVRPGSGLSATAQQIEAAGIPLRSSLFAILVRLSGKESRLKAGSYELKPGTTPQRLIDQLVRGEFAQESVAIIEGWTFKQMRAALDKHDGIRHDSKHLSEGELLAKVAPNFDKAEGLFFPDTYLFAKGSSDLLIFKQAHAAMLKRLSMAWDKRDPQLPYRNSYQALIMASIVEKETGQKSERGQIAGVFVNRLRLGMLLQTDPTVIYGMGERYQGKIHKRDLETDTPYNTYTRAGLPPTPIALPGVAALTAATAPSKTGALYFVARNDGTSKFSSTLSEHNQAVNQYQRDHHDK